MSSETRKTEHHFARIASRHVEPQHVDAALVDYAKHLDANRAPDGTPRSSAAEPFFEQWARANPELARAPSPEPRRPPTTAPTLKQVMAGEELRRNPRY